MAFFNSKIRQFVQSFAALTEPSHVFIVDGSEKNRQVIRNIAMDEPASTRSADSLMLASRQTLKYVSLSELMLMIRKEGNVWTLGSKIFTEEEMQAIFKGVMKGKILFVTPFFTGWNERFCIRLSDSA
jgi:GTP-dependent phosphoenolpyruvate carboxykinase